MCALLSSRYENIVTVAGIFHSQAVSGTVGRCRTSTDGFLLLYIPNYNTENTHTMKKQQHKTVLTQTKHSTHVTQTKYRHNTDITQI